LVVSTALAVEVDVAAQRVKLAEKADEALQRAAEAVHRASGNDIDLPTRDGLQERVEARPLVAALAPLMPGSHSCRRLPSARTKF